MIRLRELRLVAAGGAKPHNACGSVPEAHGASYGWWWMVCCPSVAQRNRADSGPVAVRRTPRRLLSVAKRSRRGWRTDKAERSGSIDAVVALAMAVERAEAKPGPARLVGRIQVDVQEEQRD